MIIFKLLLIGFLVFLVVCLFSVVAVVGFVRDLLFGGNKSRGQGSGAQAEHRSAQSSGGQDHGGDGTRPNRQRKIFSADEGEYVDFTEV